MQMCTPRPACEAGPTWPNLTDSTQLLRARTEPTACKRNAPLLMSRTRVVHGRRSGNLSPTGWRLVPTGSSLIYGQRTPLPMTCMHGLPGIARAFFRAAAKERSTAARTATAIKSPSATHSEHCRALLTCSRSEVACSFVSRCLKL